MAMNKYRVSFSWGWCDFTPPDTFEGKTFEEAASKAKKFYKKEQKKKNPFTKDDPVTMILSCIRDDVFDSQMPDGEVEILDFFKSLYKQIPYKDVK